MIVTITPEKIRHVHPTAAKPNALEADTHVITFMRYCDLDGFVC